MQAYMLMHCKSYRQVKEIPLRARYIGAGEYIHSTNLIPAYGSCRFSTAFGGCRPMRHIA